MHKGRTFTGTVHFTPEVAAQMPALPLHLHQAKPAGAAHKVAEQKPHARQQRQVPPPHSSLAQATREAVTPPPAVVAAQGKQVPASLAQEDKVSPATGAPSSRARMQALATPLMRAFGIFTEHICPRAGQPRCQPACRTPWQDLARSQIMPHLTRIRSMQDLAAQRLEALGPTSGSSANESGSEARRAQAEREFLRMEREGPPAGTK